MPIYDISGALLGACRDLPGTAAPAAYRLDGEQIFPAGTDYSDYTTTHVKNISIANTQGMEIYNGVLLQFRGSTSDLSINNLVSLYSFPAGTAIKTNMTIESGHANAVAFSNEFYADGDEFPIIYCGDWFSPCVHVNRVTRTEATHLYDIVYDTTTAGYKSNPCIDFENKILYTIGYYLNATNQETGNHCIVCKLDLDNLTDNGDGTFTPALVSSYTRPFIYIMQDLKFSDGLCWITAGGSGTTQYLYGMNPDTGVFEHTITMPITTEIEGIVWEQDAQSGLYWAYVGFQGGKYYKTVFGGVT